MMRRVLVTAAVVAVTLPAVPAVAAATVPVRSDVPAQAATPTGMEADIRVNPDGSLRIHETHDLAGDGDGMPDLVRREFVVRRSYDSDYDAEYRIEGLEATVGGAPVEVAIERRDDIEVYRFDLAGADPGGGETGEGGPPFELEYTVSGAVRDAAEGLELAWTVIRSQRPAPERITVTVDSPAVTWAACFAGREGSSMPCTATQVRDLARPRFDQDGLTSSEQMTIIVGIPAGAGVSEDQILTRRWSPARAFTVDPVTVGVGLGLVALAGLAVLAVWWLRGRHAPAGSEPSESGSDAEIEPPSGVRPGQVGTLVDERADVVDIVATVLDLAGRGYLVIDRDDAAGGWRLRRGSVNGSEAPPADGSALHEYEKAVLAELFEAVGPDGSVALDRLHLSWREALPRVQDRLYADVVANRWFTDRPDAARGRWTTAGLVLAFAGVVVTGVLAAFTQFGLVGLGLILAGGVLVAGGDLAPARTARGSALVGQIGQFAAKLERTDAATLPAETAERLLPYAVVFGQEEHWVDQAAASPRLPTELEDFVNTLSGAIAAARRVRI